MEPVKLLNLYVESGLEGPDQPFHETIGSGHKGSLSVCFNTENTSTVTMHKTIHGVCVCAWSQSLVRS